MDILKYVTEPAEIFKRNLFLANVSLDELTFMLNDLTILINKKRENLENELRKNIDEIQSTRTEELLYYYQNQPNSFLIDSIFLSLIILLENEIITYCKDFKKYKKLTIGYNDFDGDLLEKFKIFTSKLLQSDFDFEGMLWQNIVGLYKIRNSLVHNCGFVSDFGKKKSIQNFISRNKSFEIDENDRICISHQACLDSIKIVETFFNEITDFALRVFPDKHKYVDNRAEPF